MTIRVDYRCRRCGVVEEVAVSAAPVTRRCPACGGTAKRCWGAFNIGRASASDSAPSPGPTGDPTATADPGSDLCRSHPGVPGLCILSRSAGRALVARATNDGRSLEREQRRQTEMLEATGRPARVVSDHGHGHGSATSAPTQDGPREIV